mgnify:CR=1 FL=1
MNKKKVYKILGLFIAALLVLFLIVKLTNRVEEVSYNEFIEMVENKDVESVSLNVQSEKFKFSDLEGHLYKTDSPKTSDFKEFLLLNDIEVHVNTGMRSVSTFLRISSSFFMIVLLGAFIQRMGTGLKKKDSLVSIESKVTFKNIAGNEEAKEDMKFLVNFLKEPKKYNKIGAKLPKGVVLYGPPGTGKTLTARALAGEAKVPFFSINGSDFIELYAGLGAKRVRDLYKDAKKKAPSIVFIDEIDAVGTHRDGGPNDGEKNQTINALLSELDGFNTSEPVITIIATNRVEDLDRALIRPGRFDKHIAINLPDKEDRLKILRVHSKNKKISQEVNLETFANMTIGFSGAALETMMNEAAILAVNEGSEDIKVKHIDDAYYKMIIGGHKKKTRSDDLEEIKVVAYHEAGHALATKLLTDNEVPKVTIIPSTTGMGGATLSIPKKTGLLSKRDIVNNVKILYAGRAAEFILYNDEEEITTGASQDIKQATNLINNYFSSYGMSEEFGMLEVKDEKLYTKEAIRFSKKTYKEVLTLLQNNQDKLERIANELIEKETIDESRLDELI